MNQSGKFEVSGAGLVLLAVATLVASGAVFLLGVYVGKGMVESRMTQEARVVRLPAPAPGAVSKSNEVDVTFWDKLAKGEATPSAPAPAAATPTVVETPVRVAPAGAPTSAPPPAPPTPRPTEPKAAAPAPTRAPAPSSVGEGGRFQVQVNAMADKVRAEELVRDLKTLGYTAYISPAKVAEKTLYRVRVTNLASEQVARQAVGKLREQGYPQAFLSAEVGDR
jgi:cell division septation protein DedD